MGSYTLCVMHSFIDLGDVHSVPQLARKCAGLVSQHYTNLIHVYSLLYTSNRLGIKSCHAVMDEKVNRAA